MIIFLKTVLIVLLVSSFYITVLFTQKEEVKKNDRYIPIYTEDISTESYMSLFAKFKYSLFKEVDKHWSKTDERIHGYKNFDDTSQ